jgi:phosphoserine aminotransferase
MTRAYNFSAGPAALPEPVLRQAAAEMLDWRGSGMGVMEMSHRGPEFMSIHAEAQALLRELMGIPAHYRTLFMQGGALAENAILPMNLLNTRRSGQARADYIDTGIWSQKSIAEARRYGTVNVAASAAGNGYTRVPDVGAVPLVADMSSSILSRPVDVSRYACIYGGAQKNIGPAGLTIVIVRDDLIGHAQPCTPTAFDYKVVADNDSMFNTPPTWAIYIAGLVFKWIRDTGGVAAMGERNAAKSALLYGALDASGFYTVPVAPGHRSRMNVVFRLPDERLDAAFVKGAQARGLAQLKGHRSVGGMRASIYNAMPIEGVQALVDYLGEFQAAHG